MRLLNYCSDRFRHSWNDITECLTEIEESLQEERISRIAISEDGKVVGWIAGSSGYSGNVWELHPLIVHKSYRGKGVGRALVLDFENGVREKGGITIYLGTDDEDNETNLFGRELYPDVLGSLQQIKNRNGHPFEFYQKLGFSIVGVYRMQMVLESLTYSWRSV